MPVVPRPRWIGMPQSVSCSAIRSEVRFSSKQSSGWAWMSRRIAAICAASARMDSMTCMTGSAYRDQFTRRRTCDPSLPLCHSLRMTCTTVVRAACPHDCPDTCAMLVTVEDGRAVAVHGDPDASADARRAVHQGLALPRANVPPGARAAPAEARRAEGQRPLRAGELGRGARRHRRAADARSPARPRNAEAIVPYSYAGTMGLVQGESMAGAVLPPARRVAARPHDLLVGRRRGARRDLRRQGRHARRALRREPADRHLGQQLDHLEPALLDLRAAGQARRREAGLHRPAPHRDRRASATSTSRCCPAPTARSRSALMHELIVNDWLDHDYIERHVDGWPALRERALAWPPERAAAVCGIDADAGPRAGARLRHDRGRRRSASTTACSACAAAATRRG